MSPRTVATAIYLRLLYTLFLNAPCCKVGFACTHRRRGLLGSSQELYNMAYTSPFGANGIQFVNEDDGRSFFLG